MDLYKLTLRIVSIAIGFPFLFMENLTTHNPPRPIRQSWILRSLWVKGFFTFVYLGINIYIVIVTLIGPYEDGNGQKLHVKGWYYIVVVGCIVFAAVLYYYLTIGFTGVESPQQPELHPERSILRFAGVEPKMCEAPIHDSRFGFRKTVEITPISDEPSYLYWFFGGSDRTHFPGSGLVNRWSHLMGR